MDEDKEIMQMDDSFINIVERNGVSKDRAQEILNEEYKICKNMTKEELNAHVIKGLECFRDEMIKEAKKYKPNG